VDAAFAVAELESPSREKESRDPLARTNGSGSKSPASKENLMSNHPELTPMSLEDWDRLLDNPFNIGPFSRSTKADDWWVITGMHVKLPDALAGKPAGTSKLLVLADTISIGTPDLMEINLDGWSDVLLIGDTINRYNDCEFYRNLRGPTETFRVAFLGRSWERFPRGESHFFIRLQGGRESGRSVISISRWLERDFRRPVQTEFYSGPRFTTRELPLPNSGPGFDACRPFLARLLLTAQSVFEKKGTAEEKRMAMADANRFLGRIETLVALNPGVASWQEVAAQIAATREMFQPQLPGSDRVPDLSPAVYDGVAKSYGPALQKFAETFQQFVNRTGDINQRTRAMELMLNKEANAIKFQALVTEQLQGNFKGATENLSKAEASMRLQNDRVKERKGPFENGVARWRTEKEREAAMAITGAVFSFVVSVGQVFLGNPAGAANAAAAAAKAGMYAVALAEMMEKLKKLVVVIFRIAKMAFEVAAAASKLSNNQNFASNARGVGEQMANLRREAQSGLLGDAPSASAYWDQLWEEVETALRPAVTEGIGGAAEYMKELKVMVIYGRALTSAEAAIPPIAQELAQAELLTKLTENQRRAIEQEMGTLQTGKTASATVAAALWLRHRSVQRAMFAALQDYDAAHRYWALTVERPQRDPSRSIEATAEDLLEIANLQVSFKEALDSFKPRPQDFDHMDYLVPDTAVADFLRDGSFALRFMPPEFGPFADSGNVGRVRVHEVAAWVIWNEGKRPEKGNMEFTIRTNGEYYDQRVESGQVKPFHFSVERVNLTFRYNLPQEEGRREPRSIRIRAKVAEDFRDFYTEPTLFTEWQFSLPKGGGALNLEALQGAVSGIRLEFSGKYIKDEPRLLDEE
jgi:hypothetical protein